MPGSPGLKEPPKSQGPRVRNTNSDGRDVKEPVMKRCERAVGVCCGRREWILRALRAQKLRGWQGFDKSRVGIGCGHGVCGAYQWPLTAALSKRNSTSGTQHDTRQIRLQRACNDQLSCLRGMEIRDGRGERKATVRFYVMGIAKSVG